MYVEFAGPHTHTPTHPHSPKFFFFLGQQKPSPDADPKFSVDDGARTDYTTQRYFDTLLQSEAFFECGGSESLQDWQERGAYYHFRWPRDGSDSSTKVRVYSQFSGGMTTNGRMLLFDHSHFVATIQIKDGRCVNVNVQDV